MSGPTVLTKTGHRRYQTTIQQLTTDWADGDWRPRTPSNPHSADIGFYDRYAEPMLRLLGTYPRIVYIVYLFWRKLLFYRSFKKDRAPGYGGGKMAPPLTHTSSTVFNCSQCGVVGHWKYQATLLPKEVVKRKLPLVEREWMSLKLGPVAAKNFGEFLYAAATNNQRDVIWFVLIDQLRLHPTDSYFSGTGGGGNLLHFVASSGDSLLVRKMLERFNFTNAVGVKSGLTAVDSQDSYGGGTALLAAAREANTLEVIKLLVDSYGASIGKPSTGGKHCPLHVAAHAGNIEVMEFLLDRGALVDDCKIWHPPIPPEAQALLEKATKEKQN